MTLSDWELRERRDEDVIAATYHETHHDFPIATYWNEDFAAFVRTAYRNGDRVLDLGCGPGSLWPQWQSLQSAERLVGVDLSERMIAEARSRHPEGEFTVGRVHDLPFEASSFDLVIASSVLHHVPPEQLRGAFVEIARVLDEHGTLVGREPSNAHTLGAAGAWTTGAIMNFRHLLFRLTRSREPSEIRLGEHHHVPDVRLFLETLGAVMRPTEVVSRFPFSSYVLRVRSEQAAALAKGLDQKLRQRAGTMFYYRADRNHATADDVARCVEQALHDEVEAVGTAEFLAYLQAAAEEVERVLAPPR
jgi:ubiquinone/menaquinone biosynthesis C-methylase UbiE